ncbi:C39 family peptidase [Paraburkholderia humisilvae]|uniref:Peptidase C39-like domain-containing protein n=1 Tax=Paraburkholderia humisilvae TaxID=627669 RepID=A0A6J5EE51_9BURK|nr:papain-like cysteine protease family protein [Paraburkholderia humisilvae]CAB3764563.1 hypothetical protein LMG29542_04926 [Paraburkholderia humisilvae]
MGYRGITEQNFRQIIKIGEIQRHDGNCWACALSVVLRVHGINVTENYVTGLFHEWRIEGITVNQVEQLVGFFNKNYLSKQGWVMKTTNTWQGHMTQLIEFAPIQVFIQGHFIVVLGYDDDNGQTTYFDPWDGQVKTVSEQAFTGLGGPGHTVYMLRE